MLVKLDILADNQDTINAELVFIKSEKVKLANLINHVNKVKTYAAALGNVSISTSQKGMVESELIPDVG